MKKLLFLKFLFLTLFLNAQTNEVSCYKKFTEPDGSHHCLAIASKAVSYIFDAMPKIWLYKYTGTEFGKKEYSDLLKSDKLFVHYPTFINSSQEYEIEVNISTENDRYMIVSILDLNAADEHSSRGIVKIQKESDDLADKLGYAKTKLEFTPSKPKFLDIHNTMYNVAVATNLNYSIDEKRGIRPFEFLNFEKGYVSFDGTDHSGFYTAILKERYIITIKLKDVITLKDCKSVEDYITDYLLKLSIEILPNNQ